MPQILPELLVPVLRTAPSMVWMSPQDSDVFPSDLPILTTNTANYSAKDLGAFLDDLDAPLMSAVWTDGGVEKLRAASSMSPGVPHFCAYANDTETGLTYQYVHYGVPPSFFPS